MLDVPIKQSPERRSFHLSAWSFVVEPHEKSLRRLTCIGFGPVESLIPKDDALPDPFANRAGLVITKLPHVGAPLALP
jgi:hypothetical protein